MRDFIRFGRECWTIWKYDMFGPRAKTRNILVLSLHVLGVSTMIVFLMSLSPFVSASNLTSFALERYLHVQTSPIYLGI